MNVDEGRTLRNFIVGSSNGRAVACIQRRFRTHRLLRPLLLLGPSGVGKSHLLQAAANHHVVRGKRVLALRAHEFREQYVAEIRAGTVTAWRASQWAYDVLVIDELEDLMHVPSVFEELARCIRDFAESNRQVYMASVRLWPQLLDELAGRDADLVPVAVPSLAQRAAAVKRRARGRRRMTHAKLLTIARSASTIPAVCAALDRELLVASEISFASAARV